MLKKLKGMSYKNRILAYWPEVTMLILEIRLSRMMTDLNRIFTYSDKYYIA
jgi:hypothetical protein